MIKFFERFEVAFRSPAHLSSSSITVLLLIINFVRSRNYIWSSVVRGTTGALGNKEDLCAHLVQKKNHLLLHFPAADRPCSVLQGLSPLLLKWREN